MVWLLGRDVVCWGRDVCWGRVPVLTLGSSLAARPLGRVNPPPTPLGVTPPPPSRLKEDCSEEVDLEIVYLLMNTYTCIYT